MKQLILFGTGSIAREIYHDICYDDDSAFEVVAFCKNEKFLKPGETMFDLPVVAFESITCSHPPDQYDMMIAIADIKLMNVRKKLYSEAKQKGYSLPSMISCTAVVHPGFEVGDNTYIGANTFLHPSAQIGSNVFISPGVVIPHDTIIDDHCLLAVGVTMAGCCHIESNCFLAAGALLRNNIRVRSGSIIGAGAVILEDTELEGVYMAESTPRLPVSSRQFYSQV